MATFTGEEVLRILAKYHILVPVSLLQDLGVIGSFDPPRKFPPPVRKFQTCHHTDMVAMAKAGRRVRWNYSGVVERLLWDRERQEIMASGVQTVRHPIPVRGIYYCTPFTGGPNAVGDPRRVYRGLLWPEIHLSLYGTKMGIQVSSHVWPNVPGTLGGDHRPHRCVVEAAPSPGVWTLWCTVCKKDAGPYKEDQLNLLPPAEPAHEPLTS